MERSDASVMNVGEREMENQQQREIEVKIEKIQDKIMSCAVTWMQPKILILSEVSQKEKDKYHMISLILESKIWHKRSYLQNRNRSWILWLPGEKGRERNGRGVWGCQMQTRTLRMDKQWDATGQPRELCPASWVRTRWKTE